MNRLSSRVRSWLTMPMILCLALLSLLLSLSSASAATVTVTLGASADTYLSTDSPGSNFGSAESLTISQNSDRVLLRFNLALPTGATIESATLQTYSEVADKADFIVRPSTDSWEEASVTYRTQPAWDSKELARSDSALRKGPLHRCRSSSERPPHVRHRQLRYRHNREPSFGHHRLTGVSQTPTACRDLLHSHRVAVSVRDVHHCGRVAYAHRHIADTHPDRDAGRYACDRCRRRHLLDERHHPAVRKDSDDGHRHQP
jgi:hypothetical protein